MKFKNKTIDSMAVTKDDLECSIVRTTCIRYSPLIINFVIRAALDFVFQLVVLTICTSIIEQLQEQLCILFFQLVVLTIYMSIIEQLQEL
jgi:hypothetical protein